MILENKQVRLEFNARGNLIGLQDPEGRLRIPIDPDAVTAPWQIDLRNAAGQIVPVAPDAPPDMQRQDEPNGQRLICYWLAQGSWGELIVRGTIWLPHDSMLSEWRLDIENRTDYSIWQIAYPRVSGLTAFAGRTGPDWLAHPFLMGEKVPDPVAFVNQRELSVPSWARTEFGCFDVEGGKADIAFSYPGMWTMQFLAYGHPQSGGVYFAAHDGQALYKRFGLYADGADQKHAALVLKQYPEDRTATGGVFKSFYPGVVGIYRGDWWGASEHYRAWGIRQFWCQKGPTRRRPDIPDWIKKLDLWYWNWQNPKAGHPKFVVPIIRYLKERLQCEMAFHWYGSNDQNFDSYWNYPDNYPYCPDIRRILKAGVAEIHKLGVHCIPYLNSRIWNPDAQSFIDAQGLNEICQDENGQPAGEWKPLGHTACPTSKAHNELIRKLANQMIDEVGMDGAYIDQVSGCYAVPCFNPRHKHGPGGHDHWCRGYREMLEGVQRDIKSRSPDNVITSESVIECYLDLLDDDLTREVTNIDGAIGSVRALPIPMFHTVYHDYHMSYGTVSLFNETNLAKFRFCEALGLVGGCQLMISGVYAGDEQKEKFAPHFRCLEMLAKLHRAGCRFFNLGVWKPPLTLDCERLDLVWSAKHPPKADIPAVLSGCFELDGELAAVLVNHTDQPREVRFTLDPAAYGLAAGAYAVQSLYPGAPDKVAEITGPWRHALTLPPESARLFVLGPSASATHG